MTDEAKACDVRHSVDGESKRSLRCCLVQFDHHFYGRTHVVVLSASLLQCSADQTRPQGFRQKDAITDSSPFVLLDLFRVDHAGYGITKLDLIVTHSMSA